MAERKLSILALSPYHGGPRAAMIEELAAHSRHAFAQLALPPRTWPWRLRGSALHFADEIARMRRRRIDVLLASDLVDTSRLRALLPAELRATPIVQYFHADMLSEDLKGRPRDEPLAVSQLYSILASDLVLTASEFHRRALLAGAARLIETFPDAVPAGLAGAAERKVRVLPPGVNVAEIRAAAPRDKGDGPPIVLWNHPWVDEQNPRMFFETLAHLEQEGVPLRLIAVGIAVKKYPEVFQQARRRLSRHVVQFGYVPGREQYLSNLRAADVVVSTASREWFPLGVVEAVIAGAAPLVGQGLANPEVFGERLAAHSYRGAVDLRRKLARLLRDPRAAAAGAKAAQVALARRYDWARVAADLDALLAEVAGD